MNPQLLLLLGVANLGRAVYTVTEEVQVEVCDNPEVESDDGDFEAAFRADNATIYPTPAPRRATQMRVPRVHFFRPLEEQLMVMNRITYEKKLWGTADEDFHYQQSADEALMTAQPVIKSVVPSYEITEVTPTTIYSVARVCENHGDTDVDCTILPFDLRYSLWSVISDGFTFSTSPSTEPVTLNIEHDNQTAQLEWRYTEEMSSPRRTEHIWHQSGLRIQVPPNSVYRFVAQLVHETVSGYLSIKAQVTTKDEEDFRWQTRTCATPIEDGATTCKWTDSEYFQATDVAKLMTGADQQKICGSRHERLCRLRFDEDGHLYAIAGASYYVTLPPVLKATVVDATNETRTIEAEVHED